MWSLWLLCLFGRGRFLTGMIMAVDDYVSLSEISKMYGFKKQCGMDYFIEKGLPPPTSYRKGKRCKKPVMLWERAVVEKWIEKAAEKRYNTANSGKMKPNKRPMSHPMARRFFVGDFDRVEFQIIKAKKLMTAKVNCVASQATVHSPGHFTEW
jgi:hypothetical protein